VATPLVVQWRRTSICTQYSTSLFHLIKKLREYEKPGDGKGRQTQEGGSVKKKRWTENKILGPKGQGESI